MGEPTVLFIDQIQYTATCQKDQRTCFWFVIPLMRSLWVAEQEIAVNYRLAPQYPFPCALQDLLAACM